MYFELEAGSKDVVPLSVCEVALGDLVREADPAAASSCARAGRRHQRLSSCTGLMLNDGVGVAIVSALSVLPLVLCPRPGSARQAAPCTPSTDLETLLQGRPSDLSTGRGDFSTNSLKIP